MPGAPVRPGTLLFRGQGEGRFRHFPFGPAAETGQVFNLVAIPVPGLEIHARINACRIAPQHGIGDTERFDESAPVDGGQRPDTGDAVAGGDMVGRLGLVFALLNPLDRLAAVR